MASCLLAIVYCAIYLIVNCQSSFAGFETGIIQLDAAYKYQAFFLPFLNVRCVCSPSLLLLQRLLQVPPHPRRLLTNLPSKIILVHRFLLGSSTVVRGLSAMHFLETPVHLESIAGIMALLHSLLILPYFV